MAGQQNALDGRVAVVTGGTRGIGLATARALAEWGATVVLTGTDGDVAAERAAEVAAETGAKVSGAALDVTDSAAVQAFFRSAAKEHGQLDILVANAGIMAGAPIGMLSAEHVDSLLSVNVAGTIATVQAGARAMMRRKSGAIVVLASIVGERGNAGQTVYAATKAAVASVAKSASRELGRYGIRVNAVAPGVIRTDLTASQSPDVIERVLGDTSLGRLGAADEVARTIRFLVSDDASFVTGQVLGVDGGLAL